MRPVPSDPFEQLRQQVEEIQSDPGLDATEKAQKLQHFRDGLDELQGLVARYSGDAELSREAGASGAVRAKLRARQNATIREALIARGEATPDELDKMGYLSHTELDKLQEEGLLEAKLEELERERGLVLREAPMSVDELLESVREGADWNGALVELEEAYGFERQGEPAEGEALVLTRDDGTDRIVVTFGDGSVPEEVVREMR